MLREYRRLRPLEMSGLCECTSCRKHLHDRSEHRMEDVMLSAAPRSDNLRELRCDPILRHSMHLVQVSSKEMDIVETVHFIVSCFSQRHVVGCRNLQI